MNIEFDIDSPAGVCCPDCRLQTSIRIVYGFPLQEELPPRCIYGGDACPPHSPTHFCDRCDLAWCLANCAPLFFAFPSNCYFCSHPLDASDKLAYSMEFEHWMANDDIGFKLTDDTFIESLYPVCGQCRDGIRSNMADIGDQVRLEEKDRVTSVWFWIAGLVFFILFFCIATLVKK